MMCWTARWEDGGLQKENEDVLKLTTLHSNIREWMLHLGTPPPVAMETGSKSNNGEAAALLCMFK